MIFFLEEKHIEAGNSFERTWSDGINNDLSTAIEFVYVEQQEVVAI